MKVTVTCHADIRAPAEAVFGYVCDVGRWPAWLGPVVSAACEDQAPMGVGRRVCLCLAAGGRRWQEEFEVTRFIGNAFLSLEAAYSAARRIDFRIERRGSWTRLGCAVGYPVFGGAIPAVYHRVVGRRALGRMLRESLVRVTHMIEEERAQRDAEDGTEAPGTYAGLVQRRESATMRVG